MKNLKTVKQTKKTFTMTFEFENDRQLKKLKALSILCGNFNPMRKEMNNEYVMDVILRTIKDTGEFDTIIDAIADNLK